MKFTRRKIWVLLIATPVVLVLGWVGMGFFVGQLIESKLNAQLAQELGGEFEADVVWYFPPKSVSVSDARIFIPVEGGKFTQMLSLESLDLTLAELPLGKGPVLIESIEIEEPTVRFTDALLAKFGREENAAATRPGTQAAENPINSRKLSEVFRLRRLTLRGGKIQVGGDDTGRDAMVWRNIDVDTDLAKRDDANYAFEIAARSATLANLSLKGAINVDELHLTIEKLAMAVNVARGRPPEELPVVGQDFCREFEIGGNLKIDASADIPLRKIPSSVGRLTINLENGTMVGTKLVADGSIRAVNGLIALDGFNLDCGGDEFKISGARLRLDELDHAITVREIVATLMKSAKGPDYPGEIGDIIDDFRPEGLFALSGTISIDRKTRKPDLAVMVSSDDAQVFIGEYRIPVTKIKSDLTIEEDMLTISNIGGQCLGGLVHVDGKLLFDQHLTYGGVAYVHDLDLNELAVAVNLPKQQQDNLAGKFDIDLKLAGTAATAEGIGATGTFEINHGKLWEVPVMKQIIDAVPNIRGALTVGEAAGLFDVKNKQVVVKKAAVSAPAIGVQGSGTIGFDGKLDLAVIVAPLADWKKQIQSSNVPLVGHFIGEVAGTVQKGINTVTQFALYEYRIEGTLENPQRRIVPSPGLTRAGANLFNKMIEPKGKALIDAIDDEE